MALIVLAAIGAAIWFYRKTLDQAMHCGGRRDSESIGTEALVIGSPFETVDQGIGLERFSEQAERTTRCRFDFQVHPRARRDHDYRYRGATGNQQLFEVKPAHARHLDVGDDAVG